MHDLRPSETEQPADGSLPQVCEEREEAVSAEGCMTLLRGCAYWTAGGGFALAAFQVVAWFTDLPKEPEPFDVVLLIMIGLIGLAVDDIRRKS